MADLKQLKELINLMKRQKVHRLKLHEKGLDIEIELEGYSNAAFHPSHHLPPQPHGHPPMPGASAPESAPVAGTFIKSPLVGTFYASSTPGDAPFVKVGDRVSANQVVCIVEAMKVMNEVRAGESGVVKAVLVEDGHPVEFDSKLFQVE